MRSVIVTRGAAAIDFATLVAHIKGDLADEQDYLEQLVVPAVEDLFSRHTRCFLTPTVVEHRQHGWPEDSSLIPLKWGPVTAVASVTYTDLSGEVQPLAASQWRLRYVDDQTSVIWLLATPPVLDGSEVVVRYTAGFPGVPKSAQLWMLGHIAHAWANRGDGGGIPAEPLPNLDAYIATWRRTVI